MESNLTAEECREIRKRLRTNDKRFGVRPSFTESARMLDAIEDFERLLEHQISRNHEFTTACSACAEAEDKIARWKGTK